MSSIAIERPGTAAAAATGEATYALELRDLYKRFGKAEIIRGAQLAVKPGERVAIIGPNGAGKSTLFNLISGRFAPTSGEIRLHGQRIDGRHKAGRDILGDAGPAYLQRAASRVLKDQSSDAGTG